MRSVWDVARWTLRDQRGGVIGLSLTMFGLACTMTLLYPSYSDSLAQIELPPALEGFLGAAGSLASPEGFITAEVFSWLPVVIAVFAVVWGTGTIAGDEADGALDLMLAQPVRRAGILVGKALGLGMGVTIITLALYPGLMLGAVIVDVDIGAGALLAAVVSQIPLVVLYLAVGMLAAAALRTRRAAAVVTTSALVAAYALQLVGGAVPELDVLSRITPLHWADASVEMVDGAQPLRWLAVAGVAVVVLACAVVLFERREIGSGQPRRAARHRRSRINRRA